MKRLVLLCFCSLALLSAMAFPVHGNDTVASSFFRDRYHQGDLLHWLDNLSDFAVVLSETTGRWNMPDQLLFSVQGNTFGQNRFYIDGFRVNDCFASGSSLFRPDMTRHSISIDTWQSRLFFISDSIQPDFVSLTGDVGGLGGINPTTRYLINVLHKSAQERFYLNTSLSHPDDGRSTGLNPENYRPHIIGAGQIEAQYSVPSESRTYRQHLYADFGWRAVPEFDRTGISGSYTANWYKLQADGEIPLRHNPADPSLHYLLNFSRRSDLGQEFWFNADEIMQNSDYSASLYLKNPSLRRTVAYTVGLTWHSDLVRHNNPSFTRNLVDQDGEGFEPWVPDGASHSLTAAATLSRTFLPWLSLHYDGSNSLLFFRPDRDTWSNRLEWRSMFGTENYDLGYVTWHSNPFTAGLLENCAPHGRRSLGSALTRKPMPHSTESSSERTNPLSAPICRPPSHWLSGHASGSRPLFRRAISACLSILRTSAFSPATGSTAPSISPTAPSPAQPEALATASAMHPGSRDFSSSNCLSALSSAGMRLPSTPPIASSTASGL